MENLLIKQILLSAITIGLAINFWRAGYNILLNSQVFSLNSLIEPLISFLLLCSVLGLCFLLISSRQIPLLVSLGVAFSFFIFFEFNFYYLILVLLLIAALGLADYNIKKELKTRIKIQISSILKVSFPLLITTFFILLSAVYYFNVSGQNQDKPIKIPPEILKLASGPIETLIKSSIPNFNREMTVDEFLLSQIEHQSETQINEELLKGFGNQILSGGRPVIDLNDPQVKKFLKDKELVFGEAEKQALLKQSRDQLSQQFGIQLKGDEKLMNLIGDIAAQKINEFIVPYREYLPLIFAIGLFLILSAFSHPLSWFVILTTWLLVQIMLKSGIVKIEKVMVEKEEMRV